MRYEDTSGSISSSATAQAHDDADTLPNGSNGPATGNVITGAGTDTGKAGADMPGNGHVVEVRGASGSDAAANGGNMHVDGRFGTLAIDDHGNYKYVADGHAPANFRDLFQYTLADSKGGRSVADLVISRGGEIQVSENAQKIVPNPDGTVTLPAGVDLNDVHVVGRNLVVDMPDGTQIVIVDGAVFVPQLVLGGVEVPSTNLAALLIDAEPKPAAGNTQSSGGNFDVPVPPLDPGVPLGDLIPPTELTFTPPTFHEVNGFINHEPTIEIQPDGQPAAVNAVDSVNEKGLPTRNGGEPAGSGEIADGNGSNNSDASETHGGTIIIDSQDAPNTVSINGVVVTGVIGQQIAGDFGTLTITGFSGQNILYSYTLNDNTSGDNTHDDFSVTVTDHDGDQATATLVVNIIDDVPTAHPDTDSIPAGEFGPATGNVITDASPGDAGDGDSGADVVGADNAHLTSVTGFGTTTAIQGGWTVVGHYGVLTIQNDGSYSYTRNPGTPGGVQDVFNYTLTDGDNDTSSTTLTITIGDATPHTGENPTVGLDDDALSGGNPGGVGDDPNAVNTTGTLAGGGGDGPITFAALTTGAPSGFSYATQANGDLWVMQGSTHVLTVTLNSSSGAYSVTQVAPIDHSAGGDENNQTFTINYTVTDQDGDSAPGTLTISVDDDTPIAHNDVDTMATGAVGPETGNVITGAGTDGGLGGAGADSVGADTPGAISGLVSVNVPANSDNNAAGGFVVTGQYGTLTMQADGSYSYTRTDGSPVGNVSDVFTYSLTDHDGDTTTATLTINISDNGPHTGENPTVGLDDDALAGGNPGGVGDDPNAVNTTGFLSGSGGDGALTFAVQNTGAPSGFSYAVQGNGDLWVMQGSTHVLTVTVNSSTGAYSVTQVAPIDHAAGGDENNQPFAISYTVTDADGDSANGTLNISVDDDTPIAHNDTDVTSPATDTAVGNVITGVGTIEGAANADSPGADGFVSITNLVGYNGSTDGNPAGGFTVNGQYGSLQMDADGNYTYTRTPGTPGGAVDTFTYTYVDGDGDPATATLTITIADNTPIAGSVSVGLDDDALAGGNPGGIGDDPDSVNATGTLPGSGGDAPLAFGVLLTGAPSGFTYVSGGAGVVLVQQGGTTVLTVTVNSTTGAYSVVQNAPITHAAGGDENNQAFTINYTVTDSDGDSAPGTINISVDDDTPTVSANGTVQLDDDALAGGNPGGIGDDPNATNTSGTLAHSYGADGAGSISYLTTGAPSGFSYAVQGNGDLWVMQGATHVLTLTVNSTTGAYSVTQVAPIDHAAGGDENNQSFTISYQVTDHDGDSATGTLTINVDDDTPTVSANAAVQLDDDALPGGNPGGIGDVNPDTANTSGTLAHAYGADGAGSIAYLTTGAPSGFTYALQGNGDLWIMQGATHVITLTVNSSTGAYTVTQVAAIDHPAGADENDMSFTVSYNVTDHDGDSATGSIVINVDDDTPTVSANAAVQLDDDALAGGNPGGVGDDPNATNTSGTLAHSYGADGAGSIAYLNTGAPSGFSYSLQGNGDLWVMQGATHVLTLTVNSSTGAYTVTQVAPIDHPAGGDENNVSFTISYNVTDHDGDSATGSIVVNVDDDTPTVSANAAVQLDDDALAGGNPGGVGDVNPDTANTSGTLAHSYGADGAGSIAYLNTGAPSGFSYALQGNGDLWVMQGATHVITLTVNSSTGAYTVTQVAPIMHTAGGDENDQSFTISYSVTDHDGDSATGSIVINVDDDTPTATVVTTGQHVSVDESAGVQADSNDTTSGTVSALFSGVTNVGTDTDLPQYATNVNAVVASTGSSYGADGAGTTAFSLNVSAAGVDSGLNTTDGQDIFLYKEGNLIVGRVGSQAGAAAFAVAIDNTGHISMVEYLSIQHADASNPDDVASIANGALLAVVTLTDADGDSASNSVAIGNQIQFQDSGPILTAADNINIQNSGDVAATGGFHYLLGADGASADNNVFAVTGSATVNGTAVTNWTMSETSENATSAVYTFSFDYANGTGSTAHETGTLTFDKSAGTYTVDLADPIAGFTVLATAGAPASAFINYNPDGTTSQGPSDIATVQLANNFFMQFTGDSAGSHTTVAPDGTFVPVTTANFAGIETFTGSTATVTVSNSAAGVAGNTIQGGEVLDFNLYATDPHGTTGGAPTTNATSMFIELDGVGSSEDMIVVLKLYDTVTHQYTTEALMVQNGDIIKSNATLAGTAYAAIVLDNNDGLIVIEANDYQQGNSNLVIVGAQIAGSDSGVTGTAINLNGGLGASGGSSGTQAFSTDVNDNPFKIQNIGFLTNTTTNQNADLTFNVTVKDGDGDSITQVLHATVTSSADSATPISLGAAVTTVAPVVLDLNGDGAQFIGTDAGVQYNYGHGAVATAWASPQDGILVNDANHDGKASAGEFVFGSNGTSDLQGLAAYDTNHDGQLSSADTGFANFAVWQDANSNGTVDAGELQSLTARGIASISLSSDGVRYTAANGDVTVVGTGSYTRTDGSTGSLADAEFATAALRPAANSNAVLMGALAAAGLAAESAAAATSTATLAATTALTGVAAQHSQALAPVAVDAVSGNHADDLMSAVGNGTAHASAQAIASHDTAPAHDQSVAGANAHSGQAPTELLQGTQSAGHDAAPTTITAASIVMPAAQQLAGSGDGGVGAQHNAVLGQVLAEALQGGGNGSTIDHVLASLPNHGGGGNPALEALASHNAAGVPTGDSHVLAAFTAAHPVFTMEAMVAHVDAVQAHA